MLPITIGRQRSIAAAQQAVREQRQVGILMQRSANVPNLTPIDMHRMGTVANIVALHHRAGSQPHHLVCQGDQRFQIVEVLLVGRFSLRVCCGFQSRTRVRPKSSASSFISKSQAAEAVQLSPQAPPELLAAVQASIPRAALAHLAATYMDMMPDEKQEILETVEHHGADGESLAHARPSH